MIATLMKAKYKKDEIWIKDDLTYRRGFFYYNDNGKKRRRWLFESILTNSKFTHFYDTLIEAKEDGFRRRR